MISLLIHVCHIFELCLCSKVNVRSISHDSFFCRNFVSTVFKINCEETNNWYQGCALALLLCNKLRRSLFLPRNHKLGTVDYTCSEHWAGL